ncbi:hypothetical protein ABZ467_32085, partial [Streptomyces sp. NPDC005727]
GRLFTQTERENGKAAWVLGASFISEGAIPFAADSASLLVVVRGESCTGKTRTAVEALTAVPDDFQLLFPTDADSLLAMLAADALGTRTVLWLNEAQHYLDGPAGEAAAAALLRRLDADGPFIALATLWPDHDKTLTTASTSSDDPHRQARALLSQAHYVHLPNSFAEHLDAVRRAASHDASLASAQCRRRRHRPGPGRRTRPGGPLRSPARLARHLRQGPTGRTTH